MDRMSRKISMAALVAALVGPPLPARGQEPAAVSALPSGQAADGGYPGVGPGAGGPGTGYGPGSGSGFGPPPGLGFGGDSAASTATPGTAASPFADGANANAGSGGAGSGAGGGAGGDGSGVGGGQGFSPALGGTASVAGAPPGVIGDYQPFTSFRVAAGAPRPAASSSRFPNLPTPLPPGGVNPGAGGLRSPIIYKPAGFKTADNQSPRPQDRVYYSFNYFDDVNASINKRLGVPFSNVQVYHQLFGFEKTVLDGRGSLGLRLPLDTISQTPTTGNDAYRSVAGSKTALGDLSIIGKYALYDTGRNFFSVGLQVTAPTGPGGFAGNKYYSGFRDTQIQPFVGYIFTRNRFYLQGFSAINVPTNSQDVTLLFNDVSLGYFAYQAADLDRFLTAIVPVVEAHVTTPLNHRYFDPADIATTPDVVNLTFGVNTRFRARTYLSAAYITPVTGPKPFNAELALQLNIRFGGNFRNRPANFPVIGN